MNYSFEICPAQLSLVQNDDLTMDGLFDMMKDTFQVREEKQNLSKFYKETIETILLKYIFITEGKQRSIEKPFGLWPL